MTQKTDSEVIFEKFCNQLKINYTSIPCTDKKTPDYILILGSQRVLAELKQLESNEEDRDLYNQARVKGFVVAFCNSVSRVRRKIQRAGKQLKSQNNGLTPALAVIYDNGTSGGVDNTDIKTAMYGDEKAIASYFNNQFVNVTPLHAGGNRRLTDSCNTTISAVGLLWGPKNELSISIFHNHFAANPINPDWFRHDRFRHFALSSDFYDWTEI